MNEASLIRAVLPRHGTKRLAALMDMPIETARHWLYRAVAADRRRELGRRLLAEFERQEIERARIRAALTCLIGDCDLFRR